MRVGFNRAIKLEFHGARVSSDAGLFPYRDLDDAARLTESVAADLFDFRTGNNIRHSMTALLRQSVFSRLAGYEDTNDAERLSEDPVMRHVIGGRAVDRKAASTSEIGRFETDVLTHPDNLAALMNMPGKWVDRIRQRRATKKLILDMDSSVSETYGQQEGALYNGHSADDWRSVLGPVVERYKDVDIPKFFRGDAAFAQPGVYVYLEAEHYQYALSLIHI